MSEHPEKIRVTDDEIPSTILDIYSKIDDLYSKSLIAMGKSQRKDIGVTNTANYNFSRDNLNLTSMKVQGGNNVKTKQ